MLTGFELTKRSLWQRLLRSYLGWRRAGFSRRQAAVNAWIVNGWPHG